jgi:protein-tyrosine phosphatase
MGQVFEIIAGKLYGSPTPDWAGSGDNFVREAVSLGIKHVVSLQVTQPDEHMKRVLAQAGIGYSHVPIKDFAAPSDKDIAPVRRAYRNALKAGGALMIHCTAGLGRTGTVAAALLAAEEGMCAADAMERVRAVRPGAIETREQEMFVLRYAGRLAKRRYERKLRKKHGTERH